MSSLFLFCLIFILSLILRLTHLHFSASFFYCPPPILDEDFYEFLAILMKNSSPLIVKEPFYYSPLFSFVVYLFSKFSDNYMEIIKYMNLVLGSINSALIFLILKKFSRKLIYPFILAICFSMVDLFLLYDLSSMKVTLGIFLILLYLYFLLNGRLFTSGLFGGLASLIYGGVLLPVLSTSLFLLFRKHFKEVIFFIIPVIAILSFTSYINYMRSYDYVLITAVEGIHFFIGNWKNATGVYTPIPGIRPNPFGHYFDAREMAEFMEGRSLKPSEVSQFWKKLALKHMMEYKRRTIKNILRKLAFVFSLKNIPNNYNLKSVKRRTSLRFSIPFYFFIITGFAGLLHSILKFRKFFNKQLLLVNLFFFSYIVFLLMYFITDRYRLPLFIPIFIYTLLLIEYNKSMLRKVFIFLISLVVLVSLPDPPSTKGNRYTAYRNVCQIKSLIKLTKDNVKKSYLYVELANTYMKIGGYEWAYFYLQEALKYNPQNIQAISLFKKLIFDYPHKYKP